MRKILAVLATSAGIAGLAGAAHADCTQLDLQGRWAVNGLYVDGAGSAAARCVLNIDGAGVLNATTSKCTFRDPAFGTITVGATGTITLKNAANCQFGGTVSIAGSRSGKSVLDLSMSRDKIQLVASGPISGDLTASVAFSAVKK